MSESERNDGTDAGSGGGIDWVRVGLRGYAGALTVAVVLGAVALGLAIFGVTTVAAVLGKCALLAFVAAMGIILVASIHV